MLFSSPGSPSELALILVFTSLRPNSADKLSRSYWLASLKHSVSFWRRTSPVKGLFRQLAKCAVGKMYFQ